MRDVSGKEIAVYDGTNLQQWNVYGLDNIGKIDPSNHRFMYLKDHLGSVRAIIDTTNTVVYAQDYDPWGYPLENRTYDAGVLTNSKYKFTAKERDKESGLNGGDGYDYFGARYYNSRIGRWGQVEPFIEIALGQTPYCYAGLNPIMMKDDRGDSLDFSGSDRNENGSEFMDAHPNLNLTMKKGRMYAGSNAKPSNKVESDLLDLINSATQFVNVVSVSDDIISINGEGVAYTIGVFGGSERKDNKIIGTQYFNYSQALLVQNAGETYGEDIGTAITFEIMESLQGLQFHPGESYSDPLHTAVHSETERRFQSAGIVLSHFARQEYFTQSGTVLIGLGVLKMGAPSKEGTILLWGRTKDE